MRPTRARDSLEIIVYLVCGFAAALMLQIPFQSGHPPSFFWALISLCAVGVVRIFMVAWREDGSRS